LFQLDLRASVLEVQDVGAALISGALMWTAGSPVSPDVEVIGQSDDLPEGVAHHVLRIAQEGVANALKHAAAAKIALRLCIEKQCLTLEVQDDGRGFDPDTAMASPDGHFGLIGMRERAERLGGELRVVSCPGGGTNLALRVPLP